MSSDVIVPWDKDPMLSVTLHEIGHIYFGSLSEEEKQELVDKFKSIDTSVSLFYGDTSLEGDPCYHAHFHSILYDSGPQDCAIDLANEQFADIFTYHILNHNYRENDLFFEMKLEKVIGTLQKFKSSSESLPFSQ
jgi:hypothetical protein